MPMVVIQYTASTLETVLLSTHHLFGKLSQQTLLLGVMYMPNFPFYRHSPPLIQAESCLSFPGRWAGLERMAAFC